MPTPVSALIHAATLVTAGVYLMVRTASLLSEIVILIGALTALMAGIFGLYQSDMKRVIAYSTCSQLGCTHKLTTMRLWHNTTTVCTVKHV